MLWGSWWSGGETDRIQNRVDHKPQSKVVRALEGNKARQGLRSLGAGVGAAILNRVRVRGSLSSETLEQRSEGGEGDSHADVQEGGVPAGGTGQGRGLEAPPFPQAAFLALGVLI